MPRKIDGPFMLVNGEFEPFFEHRQPQKLTKCKYELVTYSIIRVSFVTEKYNREVVLKMLINYGESITGIRYNEKTFQTHYKIFVTENGVKELLLDSAIHKNFIKKLR